MKFKYFGIIKNEEFVNWDIEKQNDFLLNKKLYHQGISIKQNLNFDNDQIGLAVQRANLSEGEIFYRPIQDLQDNFYDFIAMHYSSVIKSRKYPFNSNLYETTFGLSIDQKKQYALEAFNSIYKEICPNQFVLNNRFKNLSIVQNTNKQKLSENKSLLIPFLLGNGSYFNRNLFETNEVLFKVLDFEGHLQILLSLNKEFKFEEDLIFSIDSKLLSIYNNYKHVFNSFNALKFTHDTIESLDSNKPVTIESLYEALFAENHIKKSKADFIRYVLDVHNITLAKIRSYESIPNLSHEQRVKDFRVELVKFP